MSAPWKFISVAIATAVVMLCATVAQANTTQSSVFEDDHLLLFSDDATRVKTLDEVQRLGVDTLHVLVMWSKLAPAPYEGLKPDFDAADPNAYGGWGPGGALVSEAQARGLDVLLSPTGRAPAWASAGRGAVEDPQPCSPPLAGDGGVEGLDRVPPALLAARRGVRGVRARRGGALPDRSPVVFLERTESLELARATVRKARRAAGERGSDPLPEFGRRRRRRAGADGARERPHPGRRDRTARLGPLDRTSRLLPRAALPGPRLQAVSRQRSEGAWLLAAATPRDQRRRSPSLHVRRSGKAVGHRPPQRCADRRARARDARARRRGSLRDRA